MLELTIDTSNSQTLKLVLDDGVDQSETMVDATNNKSQMLLTEIESLLAKNSKQLLDLTSIRIHTGPGSFTGLRVGAAVARIISKYYNIPINGLPPGSLPTIEYGEDTWKTQK